MVKRFGLKDKYFLFFHSFINRHINANENYRYSESSRSEAELIIEWLNTLCY